MYLGQSLLLHRMLLLSGCLFGATSVHADEVLTVEQALMKCRTTYPSDFEAKKRLSCFDSISTPAIEIKAEKGELNVAPDSIEASKEALPDKVGAIAIKKPSPALSYMERKWRLTSEGDWNITDIETYKSNYLLITNSDDTNDVPDSPSRPNLENRDLDQQDLKFQLSLKTELMNNIPLIRNLPYVTSSRVWAAYTQQSYWQVFDSGTSRPLRENDYEPELILSLGVDNTVDGVKKAYIPRMVNLGVVHQSNGNTNPLSRSWNRIYLQSGWELTDELSLMVRPWWRVPESNKDDDNPDIEKYMGYGDMTLRWEPSQKTAVSLLMRNNLRSDNKGFAQIDLQHRLFNNPYIKLHLMLSSGYGESMLDYNHSQNMFGFGISLGE
jgi:phospholipase A1